MKIPYEQLSPKEALETYCEWIMEQLPQYDELTIFSWYRVFYPLRVLLLGSKLLGKPHYAEAAWRQMDRYLPEQLPNGAFCAYFRNKPTAEMTQKEIEELFRTGNLNLADNGSNVHGLLLGAAVADPERRERYIAAARKFLDWYVPVWSLPDGSYGNGIWAGQKLNAPYTMAINVCSAFAQCTLLTGDRHYIENAERFAMFQCDNWHPCGVPVRFNLYPVPDSHNLVGDYSRIFYLLEGLIWTHYVSRDQAVRSRIEERLTEWLEKDLLKRWPENRNWFDMNKATLRHIPHGDYGDSGHDIVGFYWMAAKCGGIPHLLKYYLKHIEDRPEWRMRVERGEKFLCNPLNARTLAIMAEEVEPVFCFQATGFAGLSVAAAMDLDSIFPALEEK